MNKYSKQIEKAFYNYKALQDSSVQSTVDIAENGLTTNYDKLPVQSSNSGGRENAIVKALDYSRNAMRWCYVIEKTIEHYEFDDSKSKFIQFRYFRCLSKARTCKEVGICLRTYQNYREDVLATAELWAKKLNVL